MAEKGREKGAGLRKCGRDVFVGFGRKQVANNAE